jgi:hypothetical protein
MDKKRKYPTIFEQIKGATNLSKDIVKDFITGEEVMVDEETQKKRFFTCIDCEHLDKQELRCYLCGCFMENKTQFKSAKCPALKW